MKKGKLVIVVLLVAVCIGIYTKFVPHPLARDFKDSFSFLELSDMNQLLIMEYPSNKTYRTADTQQFADVHKLLMEMKVKRTKDAEIDSGIMRDDEVLKIRFFNNETTFAISYTFYENGDLLYTQQAMVNKTAMYRHVSDKEFARVKALVLDGKTLDE